MDPVQRTSGRPFVLMVRPHWWRWWYPRRRWHTRLVEESGGLNIDLGDVVLGVTLRTKSKRPCRLRWQIGAPEDSTAVGRIVQGPPYRGTPGKADVVMDLQADKQVTLSVGWTDQRGNPVPTPAGSTSEWSVDDPNIIQLGSRADGSAIAAAVGNLGPAHIHGVFTGAGTTVEGDLEIVVVAGLAERANIVAGEPTDVLEVNPLG
jgi:hypothetical protein